MPEREGSRIDQAFAKTAQRLEQRKKRNRELPSIVEPAAAPQQWWEVAKAASALADSVSGVPIAGPAIELLKAVSRVQDAQTAMLVSIGRDVRLIREGAFKAAQEHLATAHRYGPQHRRYERELAAAHDSLVDAFGQAASDEEKSVIRYHLGLVALLHRDTDDTDDGGFQLRESYKHCLSVVGQVTKDLDKRTVSEKFSEKLRDLIEENPRAVSRGVGAGAGVAAIGGVVIGTGGLAAAALPPVVAGAMVVGAADKLKQARRNYRVGIMLESYAPFVNAVVRTLNAVVGNATQPGLAFRGDTTTGYQLEWRALSIADETAAW
ncbi:MAG: hypothetical protein JWR32_3293 [Mycobacterium sp.]|jgi:hypothetical protein|nr:hypothetical protein [Mycobacterium sp.]